MDDGFANKPVFLVTSNFVAMLIQFITHPSTHFDYARYKSIGINNS